MKILLAGATGAIGMPLTAALQEAGHDVVALTRNGANDRLQRTGVEVLVADAMDRNALISASRGLQVDAVVHQLTSLRKPPARHRDMLPTNQLRSTGTRNLLELAAETGAKRFVTQSIVFGYGYTDHGSRVLTEDAQFGSANGGPTAPHVDSMGLNERLVLGSARLDGIALRYGLFYGAGGAMEAMLKGRKIPVPSGRGRDLPWLHLDDAVSATLAALEYGRPGSAYNIVDDEPASWGDAMRAMADAMGAPAPRALPGWAIRMAAPYVGAMLATSMRVSNDKARTELGWTPRYASVLEGARTLCAG